MNIENGQQAQPKRRLFYVAIACICLLALIRCASDRRHQIPKSNDAPTTFAKDCIIVAGKRVAIGTRVITWHEPEGYSAYLEGKHFDRSEAPDGNRRYSNRAGLPRSQQPESIEHEDLEKIVHQFVVHYDMAGCSRQCFKVLQDIRNLSVHFLLDLDGTIYQTLDIREKAWHATISNDFAVGIEMAHPGAWKSPLNADMRRWYEQDAEGWRQKFPKWLKETGFSTTQFIARPERPNFISGIVQGDEYHQFDFTAEQYAALPKLLAGLNRALPRIRLDAPRDAAGIVINHALTKSQLLDFDGVVGHFHVQKNKQDPGPAFQWERVLREARVIAETR